MEDIANSFGRTVVVATHPDDEVLGAGGTIARLSRSGAAVFVAVVTTGQAPMFPRELVSQIQEEAQRAHQLLGVRQTFWLNQPAAQLDVTPHSIVNAAVSGIFRELEPETIIIPFIGDMHLDHQLTFMSSMVAARPHQERFPRRILAYETLSETNWNAPYLTASFVPNVFVEIGDLLEVKLKAMGMFASQLRAYPHERSLESLRALAVHRGATVLQKPTEAFVLVRDAYRCN